MSKIQYILQGPENAKTTGTYWGAAYFDEDKKLIKGWGTYYSKIHEPLTDLPQDDVKVEHGAIRSKAKEDFLDANDGDLMMMAVPASSYYSKLKAVDILDYDAPKGTLEMLDNLKYEDRYDLQTDNPPQ